MMHTLDLRRIGLARRLALALLAPAALVVGSLTFTPTARAQQALPRVAELLALPDVDHGQTPGTEPGATRPADMEPEPVEPEPLRAPGGATGGLSEIPRSAPVETDTVQTGATTVATTQLTPQMLALRNKVLSALSVQMRKPVYTYKHSPWGIMHAMHAFGVETEVSDGARMVNAAGWLCWNQPCRNRTMLHLDSQGGLAVRVGDGYQGHEGQFLALLAQSSVQRDFELKAGNKTFTIEDLIAQEQATCKPGTELTFKLIGLVHYLGTDARWSNRYGEWDIPRLLVEEMRQPVIGAACGGTHRLMGQSYALSRARKAGRPMQGAWANAEQFTLQYQRRAIQLRNNDGSFSTSWFEGRGASQDIERRLQTSGHILEWMVYSLPQEALGDPRMIQSVDYLASLILAQPSHDWEIGPRGHAIRALALYDQRMFGGKTGQLEKRLAEVLGGRQTR